MTKATLRMSLLEHLSHLISESLHGGFWKIAALGARGAFLLSVLPRLPEGELALYVFISASSLLGSRTMLLGLEDEVPLAVRGECERAAPLTLLVMLGWIGALCAGLLLAAYPIVPLAVAMMSLSLASGLLVGGLARTISPAAFEQMMNLPWLLFAALALLPSIDSALELAVLMSACSILIQIVLTTRLQLLHLPSLESIGMVAGSLRASLTTSWVKLVSNLSILGAMRAFVLWPKVIVMLPLLDSIAFTIAWGEAFWQLGMVFVHRQYAGFCRTGSFTSGLARQCITSGAVLIVVLCLVGMALTWLGWYLNLFPASANFGMVAQGIVFFAAMTAFWLFRYFLWARRNSEWALILLQLGLLLGQLVLALTLPPQFWFGAGAVLVVAAVSVAGWLVSRCCEPRPANELTHRSSDPLKDSGSGL